MADMLGPVSTWEDRGVERSGTLPSDWYTSPELYDLERRTLFREVWHCVGRTDQVAEPGQYFTCEVADEQVVVSRGRDGELRAMSNVCRHRASTILEGTGRTRSVMRCPYHAWTYELDGQLAAAPSGQGFACLDRDQVALPRFRVGEVGGLVFCCIDPDQMSLEEMLGPVAPYLEWLNVSGLKVHRGPEGARWTEDFEENWKILADNYFEDYHVPVAHPILVRLVDVKETVGDNNDWCEWSRVPYRTRPSRPPRAGVPEPAAPDAGDARGVRERHGPRLHLADDVLRDLPAPHRHVAAGAGGAAADPGDDHDPRAPRRG